MRQLEQVAAAEGHGDQGHARVLHRAQLGRGGGRLGGEQPGGGGRGRGEHHRVGGEHPAVEADPPAVCPGAPQFADGGAGLDDGAGGPARVGDGERQPSHAAADAVEDGRAVLPGGRLVLEVAGGLDERAPGDGRRVELRHRGAQRDLVRVARVHPAEQRFDQPVHHLVAEPGGDVARRRPRPRRPRYGAARGRAAGGPGPRRRARRRRPAGARSPGTPITWPLGIGRSRPRVHSAAPCTAGGSRSSPSPTSRASASASGRRASSDSAPRSTGTPAISSACSLPPSRPDASSSVTATPARARSWAAASPAMPPPMTTTCPALPAAPPVRLPCVWLMSPTVADTGPSSECDPFGTTGPKPGQDTARPTGVSVPTALVLGGIR